MFIIISFISPPPARCTGVIKEATPMLKRLYQSGADDAVKVRALVVSCCCYYYYCYFFFEFLFSFLYGLSVINLMFKLFLFRYYYQYRYHYSFFTLLQLIIIIILLLLLLPHQGLCKLGSFGGGDASLQAFADGSNVTLSKACRKWVVVVKGSDDAGFSGGLVRKGRGVVRVMVEKRG